MSPTRTLAQLRVLALALAATAIVASAGPASAQDLGRHEFKVVGNWSNAPHYKNTELPFWTETLPGVSKGALTAHIAPLDELGLKGFDIGRLLKLGLFDFVHAGFTYVAGDNAMFEGVDLAGVAQDFATARKVVEAYRPLLAAAVDQTFNARLLAIYSEPTQVFYCREAIGGIADMKGKKIRVYNRALADLARGMGGVPTTIDFAEVVPALQRGVVDCAVTGTLSGYLAKWYEVATHLYTLHAAAGASLFLAVSNTTWSKLSEPARNLLLAETRKLEDRAWTFAEKVDQEGVDCNTGHGPCSFGESQNMTLVTPSASDLQKLKDIVQSNVLAGWAERCGAECAARWNETVGAVVGLTATAK